MTTPAAAISKSEYNTLRKVKLYILTYILLGQIFYKLDQTNIGFAQLTMGKEIHMNSEAFGFAAGILSFGAFLMQFPASVLYERFRAQRWLTFTMVAWGGVVTSQAFISTAAQLTALRFLLGFFEAGFLPGTYVLISTWFRGRDHGVATSFIMVGLGGSALLGGPFAGWILDKHFLGMSGWRHLFLFEGCATILWALIAMRFVSDDPAHTVWLRPEERTFMARYLDEYEALKEGHGAIRSSNILSLVKNPSVGILTITYSLAGWVSGTFVSFNPILLKRVGEGISNQYVGYLSTAPFVFGALVSYAWARYSDRGERHWKTVVPLLALAAGALLYQHATGPLSATLCLMLVQGGNFAFFVNFWPSCYMVAGRDAVARSTALINTGSMIGQFLSPIYFGWTLDRTGGSSLGIYTSTALILVMFVVMNVFFIRLKVIHRGNTPAISRTRDR